jgi:HK97 family phage major capsid protein
VPFNNIVSRTDASPLIPEEVVSDVLGRATQQSAVLQAFRQVPVSRGALRMPVLSALPLAYWVTGDTGLKQTSEVNWANKFLNIEEVAVIMPVPDAVVEDAEQNIWDESLPYLTEAVGRTIDSAVFFGTNAPASFPTNISAAAAAAGNSVTEGATAAQGGFYGDVDNALGLLEADGFDATAYIAARSARARLRAARASDGQKLDAGRTNGTLNELDGLPVLYPMRGLFPAGGAAGTNVRAFVGDWSEFVVGIRRDITVDLFREGVVQDNTGAIVYNLMQQDMSAMRVTMRLGWQVSNAANFDQTTEASRYPAARIVF